MLPAADVSSRVPVRPLPDERDRRVPFSRRFPSGWTARGLSLPATAFTGDFYMTCELGDDVWFAFGDFSGHGLRAAIFTMMVREELERAIDDRRNDCLVEIVGRLDAFLRDELPSNRFASLVIGRAAGDGTVALVNAGHCPPLVVRGDGTVERIDAGGPVVGIVPSPAWTSSTTSILPGERLLVYSDGLLEACDDREEEFGLERIASVASRSDSESTIGCLLSALDEFTGNRRHDDTTLFVLER